MYNEAHFHLFDTLFFFKLNHLHATSTYNFLHFTPFLNRLHSQVLTPRSVLLFLVNNEDFDYALLGVDLLQRRLILYDPVEARPKDTFLLHVKNIRVFLKDLFDYMPMREDQEKSMLNGLEQLSISHSDEEDFGGEIIT